MDAPKLGCGVVVERNAPGGVRGIDRHRQGLQKPVGVSLVPIEARVAGKLLRFLAENVYRSDDAAGAVLDRCDVDECHDARTVGSLDDDFLIAQTLSGREHVTHGTFRMGYQITIKPVKAIGAAKPNRWVADLRGATPEFRSGAIVADNEASSVADIDADRQEIQQLIRNVQDALVQQDLQWRQCRPYIQIFSLAFHAHTPTLPGIPVPKSLRQGSFQ